MNEEEIKKLKDIKKRFKESTKYILFVDKNDIKFLIEKLERFIKNEK